MIIKSALIACQHIDVVSVIHHRCSCNAWQQRHQINVSANVLQREIMTNTKPLAISYPKMPCSS